MDNKNINLTNNFEDNSEDDIKEYGTIIDFNEFTLDTISDYIVDEHMVSVMLLPDDDLLERFKVFVGGDIEYVDFYGFIDSRVNLVTKIEAIITAGQDKRNYTFDVPVESQAWMFMDMHDKDKEGLDEVLAEAKCNVHQTYLNDTVSIIEFFEDFLEERGIKVPTSEELKKEAGDNDDNDAVIYGEDYGELEDAVMGFFETDITLRKQWFDAYYDYAKDPANGVDELDFVTEAIERGVTEHWILKTYRNGNISRWFRDFACNHGLI